MKVKIYEIKSGSSKSVYAEDAIDVIDALIEDGKSFVVSPDNSVDKNQLGLFDDNLNPIVQEVKKVEQKPKEKLPTKDEAIYMAKLFVDKKGIESFKKVMTDLEVTNISEVFNKGDLVINKFVDYVRV